MSEAIASIPGSFVQKCVRLGGWGLSAWLYNAFNRVYDYVVYPAVLVAWGVVLGGLIMGVTSFVLDLGTLLVYRKSQVDVFGLEALKALRDAPPRSLTERLARGALQRSRWIVFVVLSLVSNPFVVTACLGDRSGASTRLRSRDWAVFAGSFLLGHAAWILAVTGAIQLANKYL